MKPLLLAAAVWIGLPLVQAVRPLYRGHSSDRRDDEDRSRDRLLKSTKAPSDMKMRMKMMRKMSGMEMSSDKTTTTDSVTSMMSAKRSVMGSSTPMMSGMIRYKKRDKSMSTMSMSMYEKKGMMGKMGKSRKATPTLADIITTTKDLSMWEDALKDADVLDRFFGEGPYTMLAPTNGAMDLFIKSEYPELYDVLFDESWQLHLLDFLFSHVIPDTGLLSTDINDGDVVVAESGESLTAVKSDDSLCFEPALEGGSCVVLADVPSKNGILHIVDGVIAPIWLFYSISSAASASLQTLARLIECVGLSEFLSTEIGLTLFAPSEDVLRELDGGELCADFDALTEVLLYHIVPEVLPSVQIAEGVSRVKTLQGSDISLNLKNPGTTEQILMVNSATVQVIDVGTNNGLIHVIDQVLSPPPDSGKKSEKKGSKHMMKMLMKKPQRGMD